MTKAKGTKPVKDNPCELYDGTNPEHLHTKAFIDLLEDVTFMAVNGVPAHEAALRVGTTWAALEGGLRRGGHYDVFERLSTNSLMCGLSKSGEKLTPSQLSQGYSIKNIHPESFKRGTIETTSSATRPSLRLRIPGTRRRVSSATPLKAPGDVR